MTNVVDFPPKRILKAVEPAHEEIAITHTDPLQPPYDTYITLGCHRETGRLNRMLSVFHKALTLALTDGKDCDLRLNLLGLHDSKGLLTVQWRNRTAAHSLLGYVNRAWQDETEICIKHRDPRGLFDESLLIDTIRPA